MASIFDVGLGGGFQNWRQRLWGSPLGQRTMQGMQAAGFQPVGLWGQGMSGNVSSPLGPNKMSAYEGADWQRMANGWWMNNAGQFKPPGWNPLGPQPSVDQTPKLGRISDRTAAPSEGYVPSGDKYVSQAGLDRVRPQPVIPSPDASGATQWRDVLAANQGDVTRATQAWNQIQSQATGNTNPGPGAPRIMGWNWGQPLYAGQSSQGTPGNPTGYGPSGMYTAYNPMNDPWAVKSGIGAGLTAGRPATRIIPLNRTIGKRRA